MIHYLHRVKLYQKERPRTCRLSVPPPPVPPSPVLRTARMLGVGVPFLRSPFTAIPNEILWGLATTWRVCSYQRYSNSELKYSWKYDLSQKMKIWIPVHPQAAFNLLLREQLPPLARLWYQPPLMLDRLSPEHFHAFSLSLVIPPKSTSWPSLRFLLKTLLLQYIYGNLTVVRQMLLCLWLFLLTTTVL